MREQEETKMTGAKKEPPEAKDSLRAALVEGFRR
jgi:hypothetical protein